MKRSSNAPVTIVDIARHLNLSPSAVSQALRMKADSTTKVSPSTVQAVRELAQKWNYRPNSSARRMKGQGLQQAGIIIEYQFENRRIPWVSMPAVLGVSDFLMSRQWHLSIIQDERSQDLPKQLPHYLQDNALEGVVVSSVGKWRDDVILGDLKRYNVPAILMNGLDQTNTVILDDKLGSALATQHLIDLGHAQIVFIMEPGVAHPSTKLREESYIETMKKAGLTPHVWSYSIPNAGLQEPEAMRHQINELRKKEFYYDLYLPQKPTGLVCASDIDAMRLSQILLEKGVRIPEDISVVGYNDLPYLDLFYPPLTTVRSDFYAMGRKAAEMLFHLILTKETSMPSITVNPELIVRKSTGSPPR